MTPVRLFVCVTLMLASSCTAYPQGPKKRHPGYNSCIYDYKADETNSKAYFQRVSGDRYVRRSCSYGLIFNAKLCICDYPHDPAKFHQEIAHKKRASRRGKGSYDNKPYHAPGYSDKGQSYQPSYTTQKPYYEASHTTQGSYYQNRGYQNSRKTTYYYGPQYDQYRGNSGGNYHYTSG